MQLEGQEETGRVRQRRRTKKQLLQAAAELMDRGEVPTVTAAADAADVSRRTAYRYFRSQEQLLSEVTLERLRPRVEGVIEMARREFDPATALEKTVVQIQRLAVEYEAALRTILRLSLERKLGETGPVRGGRRVDWIESAVRTVKPKLTKRQYERLVSALSLCLGVEALIILQDVRGLKPEQSIDVCKWTARAILETATKEAQRP